MIVSFKTKATEDLFHGTASREAPKSPQNLWPVAVRKLDMINVAARLSDLRVPPGNRLQPLKGSLKDRWSIRINDQFRIVFIYKDGNAYDVEVMDYH